MICYLPLAFLLQASLLVAQPLAYSLQKHFAHYSEELKAFEQQVLYQKDMFLKIFGL
ncbi:hypothetical protein [Segatella hominis]|uniref:hypothetical protein n=1 Tax=Segatella hominis TaxID=2518605 RepID=UPI003AAB9252